EAWPGGIRAGLAETGNAGIDQPRIDLRQRLVVDAKPLLHIGAEILDYDIGFLTMRLNAARPSGVLRLSVMLRLLRCKFWKSDPSRGPPIWSSTPGGDSILMTLAPQSASWRTQVGPARTRVRSSTVKRARALEARGRGIAEVSDLPSRDKIPVTRGERHRS